jgi:uncharacterized protein (TIGR03032 family)
MTAMLEAPGTDSSQSSAAPAQAPLAVAETGPGASIAASQVAAPARQPSPPPPPVEFRYTQSDSFVALLHQLGASLLVSTYQANKLLAVRSSGGGLSTLVRTFDKPMGLAVDGSRLALGTRTEVWLMRNAPDIAPRIEPAGQHDACFLPRSSHVTGDIGIHEIAWGDRVQGFKFQVQSQDGARELWLVSTRFSCLATLDPDYSFVPQWRPPFISALAAEDRCHLNGLAMDAGRPKFVTALGTTDVRDGWRADKPQGGCIIDVASGEFVTRGLCMPHSPRWHGGKLWVLESGTGGVVLVDPASGKRETVAKLPGFTRGLAIAGPYALVGMSKIRPTSAMDGVPLAQRREELRCGVAVIDLRSGQTVGAVDFQTAVEEIFDVQLLLGTRFPEIVGFQKDSLSHTFIVPPVA